MDHSLVKIWVLVWLCVGVGAHAVGRLDGSPRNKMPILQKSVVEMVNSNKRATWRAGLNPGFLNYTVGDFKTLCGTIMTPVIELDPQVEVLSVVKDAKIKLPKSFDSRLRWPFCSSLREILDQGHCGSCWAFGAVESLSDRFCIHGFENVSLSENDLLACCGFECGDGCDGGYPYRAWQYLRRSGVVTSKCNPYFDTVGCAHPGCQPELPTPVCSKNCIDDELWSESKHFSLNVYHIPSDVDTIMQEVYTNGPVEVSFSVYEDFAHYKSGVYQRLYGDYMGGHAVKLIGWGSTDDGVDFWLIANSWNTGWGEDGLFRIVRGVNEVGIEENVVAGLPLVKSSLTSLRQQTAQA